MKKTKKLAVAIAATTITSLSIYLTNIHASAAYNYNNYYDTYRFYGELAPASGMQSMYIRTSYPRSIASHIHVGAYGSENVEGTYSVTDTANDNWISIIDMFRATGNVTNGGTMFRRSMYTDVAASSPWDIFNLKEISITDSNGKSISSSFITVYAVKVGDINEDGVVNFNDVSVLNNYVTGNTALEGNPLRAADTNNDGYVDNDDLHILINYLGGSIEHF